MSNSFQNSVSTIVAIVCFFMLMIVSLSFYNVVDNYDRQISELRAQIATNPVLEVANPLADTLQVDSITSDYVSDSMQVSTKDLVTAANNIIDGTSFMSMVSAKNNLVAKRIETDSVKTPVIDSSIVVAKIEVLTPKIEPKQDSVTTSVTLVNTPTPDKNNSMVVIGLLMQHEVMVKKIKNYLILDVPYQDVSDGDILVADKYYQNIQNVTKNVRISVQQFEDMYDNYQIEQIKNKKWKVIKSKYTLNE